jgi:hypothetical protein
MGGMSYKTGTIKMYVLIFWALQADAALVRARKRPSKAKNLSQFFQTTFRSINAGQGSQRVVLVWISSFMIQQYLRVGPAL